MKIKKYIKTGKNKYKIILEDDTNIILYEDIILEKELLLKKEIDNLEEIIKVNNKYDLYFKTLNYLNKRQRTEKEIKKYLKKYTDSSIDIDNIINKIKLKGLLNNDLYIKSYIHDKIYLSLDGKDKIKRELLELGFKEEEITNELDIFDDNLIKERITKYINKYLKSNKNSLIVFKNKMLVNLINLGYERKDILSVLNNIYFNEDNLLLKEKEKLLKKYSKKYSDYELELIIKKKLYEKGYRD